MGARPQRGEPQTGRAMDAWFAPDSQGPRRTERKHMFNRQALIGLIGANIMKSLAPALHIDAFAAASMDRNARANGCRVTVVRRDVLDDEPPDADLIQRLERVERQHAHLHVLQQELALTSELKQMRVLISSRAKPHMILRIDVYTMFELRPFIAGSRSTPR